MVPATANAVRVTVNRLSGGKSNSPRNNERAPVRNAAAGKVTSNKARSRGTRSSTPYAITISHQAGV